MDIRYKITFHSPWHCGSGETRGADLDAVVLRDNEGFPYIPGKTMKGIIKDGMLDSLGKDDPDENINLIFGKETNTNLKWDGIQGMCHFTDAIFSDKLKSELKKKTNNGNSLLELIFLKSTSTAINDFGTADEHSLRSIELVAPAVLYGKVLNVPADSIITFEIAFKMIKRMGMGRNRGYGRCTVEIIKTDEL